MITLKAWKRIAIFSQISIVHIYMYIQRYTMSSLIRRVHTYIFFPWQNAQSIDRFISCFSWAEGTFQLQYIMYIRKKNSCMNNSKSPCHVWNFKAGSFSQISYLLPRKYFILYTKCTCIHYMFIYKYLQIFAGLLISNHNYMQLTIYVILGQSLPYGWLEYHATIYLWFLAPHDISIKRSC